MHYIVSSLRRLTSPAYLSVPFWFRTSSAPSAKFRNMEVVSFVINHSVLEKRFNMTERVYLVDIYH